MADNTDLEKTSSRRGFLKMASVSAPAAIVAVAASGSPVEAAVEEKKTSGLQDTAHTRAYLDSARF